MLLRELIGASGGYANTVTIGKALDINAIGGRVALIVLGVDPKVELASDRPSGESH